MIRAFSYNIHKGLTMGNRTLVTEPIREAIHTLDPDLVFLQEVVGRHDVFRTRFEGWPEIPQHDYFKSENLVVASYGRNVVYPAGDHGNAILSKTPFDAEINVDISVFDFERRGFLHAVLQPPNLSFNLHAICAHLGLVEYERRIQAARICDYADRHVPKIEALLIVGDFNDWREKLTPVFAKRLGLREAFNEKYGHHARTFPAKFPILRLDRIYYRGLRLKDCERLAGPPWNRLSDHVPLIADFELEPGL